MRIGMSVFLYKSFNEANEAIYNPYLYKQVRRRSFTHWYKTRNGKFPMLYFLFKIADYEYMKEFVLFFINVKSTQSLTLPIQIY